MSSMAVISSATVTVTVPGAAVLEYENPYKVDEKTQDGDHKQPLVFHLERIDMLVITLRHFPNSVISFAKPSTFRSC